MATPAKPVWDFEKKKKKKEKGRFLNFFLNFISSSGLPAGSGVLASQGDQPKKVEFFFFFNDFNLCGV